MVEVAELRLTAADRQNFGDGSDGGSGSDFALTNHSPEFGTSWRKSDSWAKSCCNTLVRFRGFPSTILVAGCDFPIRFYWLVFVAFPSSVEFVSTG